MSDTYYASLLQKFINNKEVGVLSRYPMIDKFEITYFKKPNLFILLIFVNDKKMNEDNMYQRGLDPHYLIHYYFYNLFKPLGIPEDIETGFVIYGPNGVRIADWFPTNF